MERSIKGNIIPYENVEFENIFLNNTSPKNLLLKLGYKNRS